MRFQDRYLEDFTVGESRSTLGRTVTETDVVMHAGQTGDFFPHHMDAHWAATQPMGARIAHGTLIISMAVGMTASDINSRAFSYGYDRIRFIRPVHIGDTITVTATIAAVREYVKDPLRFGLIDEGVTVSNQDGAVVAILTHVYLVERQPGQAEPSEWR